MNERITTALIVVGYWLVVLPIIGLLLAFGAAGFAFALVTGQARQYRWWEDRP
jgi:UPF0716 family protein affecting phage T7 exclusion